MSQKARVLHTSLAEFGSRVNSKDLTMSFATLLVHVEADAASDPRLALAVDLANQFDAQLIGVGAEAYRTAMYGDGGYGAAYAIEAEMSSLEAELQCASRSFIAPSPQCAKVGDGIHQFGSQSLKLRPKPAPPIWWSLVTGTDGAYLTTRSRLQAR
jgi:predicted dienelactone hydrolase